MASRYPPESGPDELFDFPCKFPIKAMGRNRDGFENLVKRIVLTHAEVFAGVGIKTSTSASGNYLSVTINIEAHSRAQLDRIYRELSDCEQVLVAL